MQIFYSITKEISRRNSLFFKKIMNSKFVANVTSPFLEAHIYLILGLNIAWKKNKNKP